MLKTLSVEPVYDNAGITMVLVPPACLHYCTGTCSVSRTWRILCTEFHKGFIKTL